MNKEEDFILEQHYTDLPVEGSDFYSEGIEEYAHIPFSRVDRLRCRGRHLIMTLWLMSKWAGMVKEPRGWFFVDIREREKCGLSPDDFCRSKTKLEEQGIIESRYKAGPGCQNLYRFRDQVDR